MAFERPTLLELIDRVEQDFISRLQLTAGLLRRAMVKILSRVIAGAAHMLHGHLEFLGRQLFPDSSEDEFFLRQAGLFGFSQNAATFAEGTFTATGDDGSVIEAGSILQRSDGTRYETDSEVTISGGTVDVGITAVEAGADGTLTDGDTLAFESPATGVDASGTVASADQDGSDQETIEELRVRFLEYLQSPPQGGAEADYIAWAKQVTGVTRAWVHPLQLGEGTVVVYFMRDDDVGGPIPSGGEVTEVQEYIEALRPVTAAVTVLAPTEVPLDLELSITPDTSEMRDAVEAEVADMLQREAEPGPLTLPLSKIRTAIGITPGLEDYDLTDPVADVTYATGEIATMGTITWM